MKTHARKLRLTRETMRKLASDELQGVAGGARTYETCAPSFCPCASANLCSETPACS